MQYFLPIIKVRSPRRDNGKGKLGDSTGEIPADEEICSSLLQVIHGAIDDISAHLEHFEVELPFFLRDSQNSECRSPNNDFTAGASGCAELAYAIARVILKSSEEILIVCSTT